MWRAVPVLLLFLAFPARAWAENPDCERFKINDPDKYLEFTVTEQMHRAVGCSQTSWDKKDAEFSKLGYVLDMPGGKQSQILSARYVVLCDNLNEKFLFCGYDARRLDAKKLEAELAELKLSPESVTEVRALFKDAQDRAAKMDERLKKEKDPAFDYKALFIDTPEAAAVAWQKFYEAHKDVFDLGTSIEKQLAATDITGRGLKKVDITGCNEMHAAFKQYMAGQKGKVVPEVRQFLQSDPLAFEMVSALVQCDALRWFKVDAAGEYDLIESGRVWRGPRNAAYWAALASALEASDRTTYVSPIKQGAASITDHLALKWAKNAFESGLDISHDKREAKVATIKKASDGWVEITFKVDKWMEADYECVDVKPRHFNHWATDGHPVWDEKCRVSGYHEEKNAEKPRSFSEESSGGIKPGMLIAIKAASSAKAPMNQGFPLEVSIPAKTKKDQPKVIAVSGIPLQ